jgi:hypothetical protein
MTAACNPLATAGIALGVVAAVALFLVGGAIILTSRRP